MIFILLIKTIIIYFPFYKIIYNLWIIIKFNFTIINFCISIILIIIICFWRFITFNIVRATISDIHYGYPGGTQHFTDAVLIYTDVVYEPTVIPRSIICCGFIGAENGEDFVFVKVVDMAS